MKAIILAAGYATRLYPLTQNTPKALLTIKGITILDYILEKVETIKEVNEIIIISNQKFYKNFIEWSKTYKGKLPINIINDKTTSNETRLGAIGDINLAIKEKNIKEDIIVLASDNYFSFNLNNIYNYYKSINSDLIIGSLADTELLNERKYAIATIDNKNKVLHLEEKPENPRTNIIIHAIYIYKKDTLPLFSTYLEEGNNKDSPGNFPSWLYKKKPLYCYITNGTCYDIGTIDTYNELNK